MVKNYYFMIEAFFKWLEVFILLLKLKLKPVKLKRDKNKKLDLFLSVVTAKGVFRTCKTSKM